MIILEKYLCIRSTMNPDGKIHYIKKGVKTWKNDFKFPVDIFTPSEAKKFILSLRLKGLKIETETEFGEPYVYRMYVQGRSASMPFKLDKNGQPAPFIHLYPGYAKNGKSLEWFPSGCLEE